MANLLQSFGNTLRGIANAISSSGKPDAGPVIAGTWPEWEQTAPRTQAPSPYTLAVQGYRKNELVYALIQKRRAAICEPSFVEYDETGDTPEALDDSPLTRLLRRPNPQMGWRDFIGLIQMYLDIAGNAPAEIEFNNFGEPIALWPMRPDYCQYLRGEHLPLNRIRYIYPGFPVVDIPIERLLVFQETDPIYPGVMGFSRTQVCLDILRTDNNVTRFLDEFFAHGSVVPGLLKTQQQLNDQAAELIRRRWAQNTGDVSKWGTPAVVGSGVEYQNLGFPLKDLDVTSVDGRTEARICAIYETPPILIGAKVGLSASTYSNYEQARKAWYEETILPRWRWLADVIGYQMLPHYGLSVMDDMHSVKPDLSEITVLQEERTARWQRADMGYKSGWITKNEARSEAGLDPIDDETGELFQGQKTEGEKDESAARLASLTSGSATATPAPQFGETDTTALAEWRKSAIHSVTHNTALPIPPPVENGHHIANELNTCKSAGEVRAVFERYWPSKPKSDMAQLADAIRAATAALGHE